MTCEVAFQCSDCGGHFDNEFKYWEHRNIHTNETPFLCIVCRKSFKLLQEYIDHFKCSNFSIRTAETCLLEDNQKNVCKNCSESFEDDQNFTSHSCFKPSNIPSSKDGQQCSCCACKINQEQLNDLMIKASEGYECTNCNKKFSTNLKLTQHNCLVTTFGDNFKCSCLKIFSKASEFKAHIGEKPYKCCSCSMEFNTVTNLTRHIRTHTKQKPYICKDCGRGFSQSANLRNHSSIHLGIKAIKCNECNFSCKTLNGLIKHKKKHEGGNHQNYIDGRKKSTTKSTCPVCNKQFLFKRNMGMHMKIHSTKSSLCTECGKVFDSKSKLTSHYKACHREPSVCKTCGKVFASAVLLSAHEKIHVSDKIFSCEFCQKSFTIKNYLVQHLKTHSNKKQFSCTKCGKLFKVAVSLKYHNNICTV